MSGSTQRKLRSKIICERVIDDVSEETSARTRPLSYDEVMLKRKSKKDLEGHVEEAHEAVITRHEESARNPDHQSRDANGASMKNSRNHLRESSPRKVEKRSRTEHSPSKAENKERNDVENRSKHIHHNDVNNASEPKSDRQVRMRSKAEERTRGDAGYNYENKHRDFGAHDRFVEKNGGESGRENKRRDRSGNYESYRMREPVKKHDSGRQRDYEISEGREKIELSRSHHDETKTKRRRSRSPERMKEKARRSSPSSPKSQKIVLDHLRDQGELSLRSERDSSRRHSDANRTKARRSSSTPPKVRKSVLNHVHDHVELSSRSRDKSRRHPDIERKKTRRSSPSSPKARKNVLDHVHDQGELSSHFGRDKSRHQSDADKSKVKRSSSSSPKEHKSLSDHHVHDQGELSSHKEREKSSRNSDAERSKARRSSSSSPKARKNVLDHVHDHNELSSRSERDKSRRHPDVDRNKVSSDGSNHHRRHGISSSGLGGYSPRKRKSEAAVKTPSPIRSPERKNAGWDRPLSGSDKSLSAAAVSGTQQVSQPKPSNMIELAAGFSPSPIMGKPISAILSNSLSAFKQASIDSVQLTQATRPMRRLYIDNIPGSATEKDIIECFNTFLLASGSNHIRGTHPCISCMINKEKGQALVEFLTPEDASAALSFDGRSLSGSILKIRRPKDFVEAPVRLSGSSGKSKVVEESVSEVSISDFVKDSPHKIFVGGIGEGLSSEMIMEIVSSFGTLKAYRFEVNEDLKEPCAFLEYADQSVTLKACAGLNGMKLGGKVLTVSQAVPNTESLDNSATHPFYGIPEHVKPLLEMPTQVLKLKNVLDQKTLDSLSEVDLEEIVEDVRLECSRFGSVVSINAVRGGNLHTSDEKEVTYDGNPVQPPEGNHQFNVDPIEVSLDHEDGSNRKPPTNTEVLDIVDGAEGDMLEVAHTTTSPDVEAGTAGTATAEDLKGTDKTSPKICDDSKGDNDQQEATVVGLSTIDDIARENDPEGDHQEAFIQESGVSPESISGNAETVCAEDGIFEVGCVLVEFRRTEASCMAAHCLHGRVFDDRIVTVEYVPLKAYRERFPK